MSVLLLVILFILVFIAAIAIRAAAIWGIWNWVIVSITAADEITFMQSLLVSALLMFVLPSGASAAKNVASKS